VRGDDERRRVGPRPAARRRWNRRLRADEIVGDSAHGGGEGRCPPLLAARHRHPPAADDVERGGQVPIQAVATDVSPRASRSEATIMGGYSRRPARLTPGSGGQVWFRGPSGGGGGRAAAARRRSTRALGARSGSGACAGRSAAGRV
jgi:hypothetical protein